MISVASALNQEDIKELLDNYNGDNFSYKFIKKEGIKLFFESSGNADEAARNAREIIKNTVWGKILYFKSQAE